MRYIIILLISCLVTTGCASTKAMNQPRKKDLSVLAEGNERKLVIGELGSPVHSEKNDKGNYVDTYSFIQGYTKGTKAARAAGHTLLSIGTLGIWEIAGQGIEGAASGDRVIVEVVYSNKNLVETMRVLRGKENVSNELLR